MDESDVRLLERLAKKAAEPDMEPDVGLVISNAVSHAAELRGLPDDAMRATLFSKQPKGEVEPVDSQDAPAS